MITKLINFFPDVFKDGGLLANNPTAIAVSEAKLLWPDESLQCVVSLGNGRYEPNLEISATKSAVKDKVAKLIDAATNTESMLFYIKHVFY